MSDMPASGDVLVPGYTVIEQLSRTRRLDTFEVWSEERADTRSSPSRSWSS